VLSSSIQGFAGDDKGDAMKTIPLAQMKQMVKEMYGATSSWRLPTRLEESAILSMDAVGDINISILAIWLGHGYVHIDWPRGLVR
jgi:hypothetical protein